MRYKKIYIDKENLDSKFRLYLDCKGIGDDLFIIIPLIKYEYNSLYFDNYFTDTGNTNINENDINKAKEFFNKYFCNCFVKILSNGRVIEVNYLDIEYCSDEIGN